MKKSELEKLVTDMLKNELVQNQDLNHYNYH